MKDSLTLPLTPPPPDPRAAGGEAVVLPLGLPGGPSPWRQQSSGAGVDRRAAAHRVSVPPAARRPRVDPHVAGKSRDDDIMVSLCPPPPPQRRPWEGGHHPSGLQHPDR